GDFNGDGKLDLATENGDVLLGNGDAFQSAQSFGSGGTVTADDLNGDGRLDLVGVNNAGVNVLLGCGDGSFVSPITTAAGDSSYSVVTADFNADGRADVAAVNYDSNTVSVLLNDGVWPDLNAPRLRIGDVTVIEGNTGTVSAVFTVTLSAASDQDVTVQYAGT